MQAGRFTPEQALAVVPKICDALQFAHNEGVLHRDIKPENILLDSKGRIKIADFGIAKLLGETPAGPPLTHSGGSLGTPHYMAPEQIERPASVDHRADIYSLGVVFYEMLTGELPLGRFQPPSQKVQVDVRLDDVVLHALEKEPARRYQKISEVKTAVTNIAETPHQKTVAQAGVPLAPVKPDLFWRRFALAAGIIVLAMILIPVMAVLAAMIIPAISKARTARAQAQATAAAADITSKRAITPAIPRMTLSAEHYTRIHPETNEANWAFKGFVPPSHLATLLFVTWSNGVPAVDKGSALILKWDLTAGSMCHFARSPVIESLNPKNFKNGMNRN
jgi:serine/threonine protein kinase